MRFLVLPHARFCAGTAALVAVGCGAPAHPSYVAWRILLQLRALRFACAFACASPPSHPAVRWGETAVGTCRSLRPHIVSWAPWRGAWGHLPICSLVYSYVHISAFVHAYAVFSTWRVMGVVLEWTDHRNS